MLSNLYKYPLKVYILFSTLALFGVLAGLKLPVSLYPNSSKPDIIVEINYGSLNAEEFLRSYGKNIEANLETLKGNDKLENISASYRGSYARYILNFSWGADPDIVYKKVTTQINSLSTLWPSRIRESININFNGNSSGFLAISFFSKEKSNQEVSNIIEPILQPQISSLSNVKDFEISNSGKSEIMITLDKEAMASLGLYPVQIEKAVSKGLIGSSAGQISIADNKLSIEMPRLIAGINSLKNTIIVTSLGKSVYLRDVAEVEQRIASASNKIVRTSGSPSVLLHVVPKTGGNIKEMSESVLDIVENNVKNFPRDIEYRVLVDPSEFIRSSVNNVIHEVAIAGSLAVLILFLFVGSLRNTITAAVEIPLSMVLAFILMKFSGMNLNLISLGGLAIAAGMNVDASVVTLENIFRHFEKVSERLSYQQKYELILKAVKEVSLPIIASTVSTLVVFIPLSMTSNLTNAILGDLAKAVIFSHGFSMIIALILVPTIRLQLMGRNASVVKVPKPPLDKYLTVMEDNYSRYLRIFINNKKINRTILIGVVISFTTLLFLVLPNLKKEIIGTPDTDWMVLSIRTSGNSMIQQIDHQVQEVEGELKEKFKDDIRYTFTQVFNPNIASILVRLKDKHEMNSMWKKMDEAFISQPGINFSVFSWNPAELPLPNPPDMRVEIVNKDNKQRSLTAMLLLDRLKENELFSRLSSNPAQLSGEYINLIPELSQWDLIREENIPLQMSNVNDLLNLASTPRVINKLSLDSQDYPIKISFPKDSLNSIEKIKSYPIKINEKFIPLNALVTIEKKSMPSQIYRRNQDELISIMGRNNKGMESEVNESLEKTKKIIKEFNEEDHSQYGLTSKSHISLKETKVELIEAISQLKLAIVLSLLLIFLTIFFQFGSIIQTLIVMVSIPLGISGGILSLWLGDSTLSLNSLLGIILLNGIAVNNSIILVQFIRSNFEEGMSAKEAAILSAKKRLRPIIITTLTTIFGMLPMALGIGDGGKILKPLGISISGGLWVSTLLTIFIVPYLQYIYLMNKKTVKNITDSSVNKQEVL